MHLTRLNLSFSFSLNLSPPMIALLLISHIYIGSRIASHYHLYADDLQTNIHITILDLQNSISKIDKDLTNIEE